VTLDLAMFQTEITRDVCRLVPTGARIEFPPVTQAAPLAVGESRAWYGVYERGHAEGTRDEYERAAAEQLTEVYERWQDDRLAAWTSLLVAATWPAPDLELWANWLRRLPESTRHEWEDRLEGEESWWAALVRQEQTWWDATNQAQGDWLEHTLEASRSHRKKGFLGHLQAPDAAWQSWLEQQEAAQMQTREAAYQAHRAQVLALLEHSALKPAFYRGLRTDVAAQLNEIKALAPEDHAYWSARIAAWGPAVHYGSWREWEDFWERTALDAAQALLRLPEVKSRICSALGRAGADAFENGKTLGPVWAGLVTAGIAVPPAPLVVAAMAVLFERQSAAALCGTA
jgi:hypothetical protein